MCCYRAIIQAVDKYSYIVNVGMLTTFNLKHGKIVCVTFKTTGE
jgi:hypothetical protein